MIDVSPHIRKIKVASLLDPAYCDVIVKRWEDVTGKKAVIHVA